MTKKAMFARLTSQIDKPFFYFSSQMETKEILRNKFFWIASAVAAAVIFAVAVSAHRTYRAETAVLFLPKSENATRNIDQIIANAGQIPLALSFYDKLLEKNPDIEDAAAELSKAGRKEFWNAKIETARIGKSGILRLGVSGADEAEAEMLGRKATSDLLVVMSNYYNVKTDLDIRIVDGPIVSRGTEMDKTLWLLLSSVFGVAGVLAAVRLFAFLNRIDAERLARVPEEKQAEPEVETPELPKVSFAETRMEKKEGAVEKKDIFDFNAEAESVLVQPKKKGISVAEEKKAAAPSNLPVSEEEFAFGIQPETAAPEEKKEEIKSLEEMIADAVAADTTREATPEEVKARLNKLLKGDM